MNIRLDTVTQEEFSRACMLMIGGFAELLRPTRDLTHEQAMAESSAQFATMLPKGLNTPCQNFRKILYTRLNESGASVTENIGFVWVHINPNNKYGIVCWFEIYEPWRGQHLSQPSFECIEQWLRDEMGVPVLNLEVFTHNARAISVYEHCGFKRLGYVMQKKLKKTG